MDIAGRVFTYACAAANVHPYHGRLVRDDGVAAEGRRVDDAAVALAGDPCDGARHNDARHELVSLFGVEG